MTKREPLIRVNLRYIPNTAEEKALATKFIGRHNTPEQTQELIDILGLNEKEKAHA